MHQVSRETVLVRPCQIRLQVQVGGGHDQLFRLHLFGDTREATSGEVEVREGWVLKPSKKAYRFNQNQTDYLNAKFTIGQTSSRKLDGDIISREMRRARGPDAVRLFKVSEFLTPHQCTYYFSCLAAKVRQQTSDDAEIQAVVEEENFTMARETILSICYSTPSLTISTIAVPWPREDLWSDLNLKCFKTFVSN